MPSQFDVIDREIPIKGVCYLICRGYDPSDFSDVLARLTNIAFDRGAQSVYAACRDKSASLPREGFCAGGRRFSFDGEFYLLYKNLSGAGSSAAPLSLKPLRAGNAVLYRDLYNESFFSVPNAKTMDEQETDEILSGHTRSCGFLMEGGLPVGIYELSSAEQVPEIAALGISPALQRQGYGRRALQTLEGMLHREGHQRAQLLVSSKNRAALALYRSAGYGEDVLISTWFRTDAK